MRHRSCRALLLALVAAGCGGGDDAASPPAPPPEAAPAVQEIAVRRVSADLGAPDPGAAFWSDVPRGRLSLLAQPMIAPRPASVTTEWIEVQAAHDGTTAAFRLRWADSERSEAGRLGEFSDAVALEFPISKEPMPPVFMGAKDMPVHLFHWRAQYQRDAEKGKPEIADLYPNASVDMYPMDFKEAPGGSTEDKAAFHPGVAIGNPQSFSKTGVDEIVAEGFSTSSVAESHGSAGKGTWADGHWTVVVTRPLAIEGGSVLDPAKKDDVVAFAVWQGGLDEVASRKCLTMAWIPLRWP